MLTMYWKVSQSPKDSHVWIPIEGRMGRNRGFHQVSCAQKQVRIGIVKANHHTWASGFLRTSEIVYVSRTSSTILRAKL